MPCEITPPFAHTLCSYCLHTAPQYPFSTPYHSYSTLNHSYSAPNYSCSAPQYSYFHQRDLLRNIEHVTFIEEKLTHLRNLRELAGPGPRGASAEVRHVRRAQTSAP